MKLKLLSSAVLASIGAMSTAQAVNVNPDGLGQVLIYPYYTVQEGFDTNIHVVNTSDEAKVVKVRFLEAMNSQEVLDFNLFLSPWDEWTGSVVRSANGAMLRTHDTSCTAPMIPADGVEFRNFQYSGDSVDTVARTREGYVEIIEMGVVDTSTSGGQTLFDAVKHGSDGVPANCGYVQSNDATRFLPNMTAPEGGLYGYGTLVNGVNGVSGSYDALAINAWRTAPIYTGPGSDEPSIAQVSPAASGNFEATVFDGMTAVTLEFFEGIDAVSAALMHSRVMNDYVVDPNINAGTDWVVNFPTKRFYVNGAGAPFAPFTEAWSSDTSTACETIDIQYYDREEQFTTAGIDFSPMPPQGGTALCYEANAISINGSNLLGAEFAAYELNLASGFTEGWMYFDFTGNGHELDTVDGQTMHGLPAIGFAMIAYTNGDVGGLLANYGSIVHHKAQRPEITP